MNSADGGSTISWKTHALWNHSDCNISSQKLRVEDPLDPVTLCKRCIRCPMVEIFGTNVSFDDWLCSRSSAQESSASNLVIRPSHTRTREHEVYIWPISLT